MASFVKIRRQRRRGQRQHWLICFGTRASTHHLLSFSKWRDWDYVFENSRHGCIIGLRQYCFQYIDFQVDISYFILSWNFKGCWVSSLVEINNFVDHYNGYWRSNSVGMFLFGPKVNKPTWPHTFPKEKKPKQKHIFVGIGALISVLNIY